MLKTCPECKIAKSKFNSNGRCNDCERERGRISYALRHTERVALHRLQEQELASVKPINDPGPSPKDLFDRDPGLFPKDVFSRDPKPFARRWNVG